MGIKNLTTNKSVLLLTAAFFTLTSMTPHRVNFSGTWKLNESKSKFGHWLCIWDGADRMRSKAMKIFQYADFLIIDTKSPFPGIVPGTSREKLTFNGKEGIDTLGITKKFSVKWSMDGQTMIISSVIYLNVNGNTEYKVTEAWKLINNGKSMTLQADTKSSSGDQDTLTLVYDKAS